MSTMTSEREAFEKWADDQGYPMQRLDIGAGEDYQDLRTQGVWVAWQARAQLTQPAQAVDAGAIREVIEQMGEASLRRAMAPHYDAGCYGAWIDALTRALSGEKAGLPASPTPDKEG